MGPGVRPLSGPGGNYPQYVEIREDVNHHREIETELEAPGYEYAWQRKLWRVWRINRYVPDFGPDFPGENRPAEEPSAPPRARAAPT